MKLPPNEALVPQLVFQLSLGALLWMFVEQQPLLAMGPSSKAPLFFFFELFF